MRRRLQKIIHSVWAIAPGWLQRVIVRITQDSFRVTVAIVVVSSGGSILLLHHVFRGSKGWGLPAGFVEHGENPEVAAVRELKEETGLEIDSGALSLLAARELRGSIMEIGLAIELDDEPPLDRNFEIDEAIWCDPAELPVDMTQESKTLIDVWLARND